MVFANERRCATAKLRLLAKCRSLSPTQIQSTFVGHECSVPDVDNALKMDGSTRPEAQLLL
jgi:hypothetical protein